MNKDRRKRFNKKLRKKENKKELKRDDLSGTITSENRLLLQMTLQRSEYPTDLELCHQLIEELDTEKEKQEKLF